MKQRFGRQHTLPKTCVFSIRKKFLSPEVLALDGCFSREKPYHDQGDSLVWSGPQWMDPLEIAYTTKLLAVVMKHHSLPRDVIAEQLWASLLNQAP